MLLILRLRRSARSTCSSATRRPSHGSATRTAGSSNRRPIVEVPLLVGDFLRRAAKLYPDKVAIVDGDRRITYLEYQERANQLAHALLKLGVRKGDRVCLLSPNSHFFLEAYYGVLQIGAVLVPLNYRLVAADHEYIINHAGVSVVLVDHEYTAVIDGIRPRLTTVRDWIVAKDEGYTTDGWTDWEKLIADEPV